MIAVNQLRRRTCFEHEGKLLKVIEYSHRQPGRGKAIIRVKVQDLRSGSSYELTFPTGKVVQDIRLEQRAYQYLYNDGQFYVFMDIETFEQKYVQHVVFDEHKHYLSENATLELLSYEGEVLDYILPQTMDFEVAESENAIAGDTATGATKTVVTTSGLEVRTPLFIDVGDIIRVNTESGNYITRV